MMATQSRKGRGFGARLLHLCLIAAAVLASANTALAQTKTPIGRFVAEVRGASAGLPTTLGWTPLVPSTTVVPSRGLGVDVGAHVYLLRFRRIALGVGATWLSARAGSSPPAPTSTTGTSTSGSTTSTNTTPTIPQVTTRLSTLAPQLSLNFGHSLGWSYLSAGLGQSRVKSEASTTGTTTFTPRDSGQVKTLNFGGGARWFVKDHIGFGFDLRWYKLSLVPATATHPGAPRASLFAAGAGVVLK